MFRWPQVICKYTIMFTFFWNFNNNALTVKNIQSYLIFWSKSSYSYNNKCLYYTVSYNWTVSNTFLHVCLINYFWNRPVMQQLAQHTLMTGSFKTISSHNDPLTCCSSLGYSITSVIMKEGLQSIIL